MSNKKKVGIFCHGQAGDIMEAMSVLDYSEKLWGDAHIVWFACKEYWDIFKGHEIEVREFPRGFGYPELVEQENKKIKDGNLDPPLWEDWKPLVDENNHLNIELAKNVPSLAEFDLGYFPAPHQVPPEKRGDLEYSNISKKIFGVPMDWEWHPCLMFMYDEIINILSYFETFPKRTVIAIETFGGSSQSAMNDILIKRAMELCNEIWGECKFVFVSHKYLNSAYGTEEFPNWLLERKDVHFVKEFTVRQCGMIVSCCNLLLSVSSGITVAASSWGLNQPPTIQYTGSKICSTLAISNTDHFELVTTAEKNPEKAEQEYLETLSTLLYKLKS